MTPRRCPRSVALQTSLAAQRDAWIGNQHARSLNAMKGITSGCTVLKAKSMSVNVVVNMKEYAEEDRLVNVAKECNNEECKTSNTTWFNMETAETFFFC